MNFSVEKRQKFLTPLTLRIVQVLFDLSKKYPYITSNQVNIIKPLFIIGSGRCGSTMLRSILLNYPDIHIPPESAALPGCAKKFARYGGLDWKDLVHVIIGEFTSYGAFEFWDVDLTETKKQLIELPAKDRSLAIIIDSIFIAHLRKNKPQATIWADKTTFNTLRLNWINRIFPEAKYINLVRDGRDVVSSFLKTGLASTVEEAAWRWTESLSRAEKLQRKVGPEKFLKINYENLVRSPEAHYKKIIQFLGLKELPYQEKRAFDSMGDTVLSHHDNVKNPINENSVGKWRTNLSIEEQEKVNQLLSKWLKKEGYL